MTVLTNDRNILDEAHLVHLTMTANDLSSEALCGAGIAYCQRLCHLTNAAMALASLTAVS